MTRAQFQAEVFTYLDVDARRRGSEALINAALGAACRDLAHYVPRLAGAGKVYASTDPVPFTVEDAEAVAEYVKERVARQVLRDAGMAREHNAQYRMLRRRLYLGSHDAVWFEIRQGELQPYLRTTLKVDDEIVNLAGIEYCHFVMKRMGDEGAEEALRRIALVITAASGLVEVQWQAGDTDFAGKYVGVFEVGKDGAAVSYPSKGGILVSIMAK